jgi:hypothetical protein
MAEKVLEQVISKTTLRRFMLGQPGRYPGCWSRLAMRRGSFEHLASGGDLGSRLSLLARAGQVPWLCFAVNDLILRRPALADLRRGASHARVCLSEEPSSIRAGRGADAPGGIFLVQCSALHLFYGRSAAGACKSSAGGFPRRGVAMARGLPVGEAFISIGVGRGAAQGRCTRGADAPGKILLVQCSALHLFYGRSAAGACKSSAGGFPRRGVAMARGLPVGEAFISIGVGRGAAPGRCTRGADAPGGRGWVRSAGGTGPAFHCF